MTQETRQELRRLVDQRRRQLVADDIDLCAGCGTDRDNQTDGCKTCWERHYNRRKRAVAPDVMRAIWRAAHRRRRDLHGDGRQRPVVCAGCGVPHDHETPGCRRCYKRHWNRHTRRRTVAA